MAKATQTPVVKVGSIADTASRKVDAATKAMTEAFNALSGASEQYADVVRNTQIAQDNLDLLTTEYDAKKRNAEAELAIQIKENESAVLSRLLRNQGKVAVSDAEYSQLTREAAVIQQETQQQIKAATAAAKSEGAATSLAELNEAKQSHAIATADLNAEIKSQAAEIDMLESQITYLKETLKEEREARIKLAEYGSRESVVVNTTGSK